MTQPDRAARLWLAVAGATLWLLRGGGAAEETMPASPLRDVGDALLGQRRQRRATRLRLGSILRRGWSTSLVAVLNRDPRPLGVLLPKPWPTGPELVCDMIVTDFGVRHDAAA
jgi:hypothetical protein